MSAAAPAPGRALRVSLAWLPVLLYTGLIWFLSSQKLPDGLVDDFPLRDKGVHFLEYGALATFMAHALHVTFDGNQRRYVAALWLTAGLGLVDELHQLYVPGRSGDINDLVADTLGATLAIALYALLRRAWSRRGEQALSPP